MDGNDLRDYAQSNLEKVLARVPGVGEVQIFGSQYAMRVWLNPDKLNDYRLTVEDVIQALKTYNVEVSAGQFGGAPAVKGQRLNTPSLFRTCSRPPRSSPPSPFAPTGTAPSCGSRTWDGRNWGPNSTISSLFTMANQTPFWPSDRHLVLTRWRPPTPSGKRWRRWATTSRQE